MCLASKVAIDGLDHGFVPEQTLKIDVRTSLRCHMKLTYKIAVNGLDRDFVPEHMLKLDAQQTSLGCYMKLFRISDLRIKTAMSSVRPSRTAGSIACFFVKRCTL